MTIYQIEKQRVKMNEEFSLWSDIEYGAPQGSILGPLLFNIHLCDLFYFLEGIDIASYANDTTLCTVKETKVSVINALKTSSQNNFMKDNSDKNHFLMSCSGISTPLIDGFSIDSSIKEVLLGITIDKELKFEM